MNVAVENEKHGIKTTVLEINGTLLEFDHGRTYLIMDEKMDRSFIISKLILKSGYKTLCISRYHPEILIGLWSGHKAEIVWISGRLTPYSIPPTQLNRIRERVERFVRSEEGRFVLLDGIEYISLYHDFPRVLRFIEELNDIIMESRGVLLISIDPRSFDVRSLALLRRFSEVIQ